MGIFGNDVESEETLNEVADRVIAKLGGIETLTVAQFATAIRQILEEHQIQVSFVKKDTKV